ncbi:hypothetical protein C0J52_23863 [Blattella germanica]|nr:hypothetical protein C0J52_23863 [Blattella germanica]
MYQYTESTMVTLIEGQFCFVFVKYEYLYHCHKPLDRRIITVQRNYQREYGENAPDGKTIKAWCEKFLATGSVKKESGGARKRVTEEKIEEIRIGFQRSPQKSIHQAFR